MWNPTGSAARADETTHVTVCAYFRRGCRYFSTTIVTSARPGAPKSGEPPIATLVREAIDATWPAVDPGKAAAFDELMAAEPMPVPDVDELLQELDGLRSRRA